MHNTIAAKHTVTSKGVIVTAAIDIHLLITTPTTAALSFSAEQMQLDQSMSINLDNISDWTDQLTALSCDCLNVDKQTKSG